MKIKEILELTKTKPIADIAKELPVSEKPLRTILKGLKAEKPAVGAKGWSYENVDAADLEKDISEFVKRKAKSSQEASNSTKNKNVAAETKSDIITTMFVDKMEVSNMKAEIQALIKGTSKEENNRIYKGIYFDKDIANFIDNVVHGNKSEIVNKIMRQFLTENELL
jgi:hypothetical protein